jgi:ABC-type Fe3+ transport system substrate-binding protein
VSDEVLVYATLPRADTVRRVLGAACAATGVAARLELYGSGSLFQRLGPRHAPPLPDLTIWTGPFAAHAAARASLLQPYQPARTADSAAHDAEWRWMTLDYFVFGVDGLPAVSTFDDLGGVASLGLADPERSETGTMLLLASLDRARQVQGDVEQGWAWWERRARAGIRLFEDEAGARAAVGGGPSHAIGTSDRAPGLLGLAPVPNALALASNARNVGAARRILDWLCGEDAAALVSLSPWQASANGLQNALQAAPALDVEWGTQQYSAARRRWADSGFGPTPTG